VRGELAILAEDHAMAQACEAEEDGESSPANEFTLHSGRSPVGHALLGLVLSMQ